MKCQKCNGRGIVQPAPNVRGLKQCDICKGKGEVPQLEKPPLGLRPRIFWLHERRKEILDAIDRYLEKGVEVPIEWVQEYNELTKEVNK